MSSTLDDLTTAAAAGGVVERAALLEQLQPMIRKMSYRAYLRVQNSPLRALLDPEDVIQQAQEIALNLAFGYDPSRGNATVYFYVRLASKLRQWIERLTERQPQTEPLGEWDGAASDGELAAAEGLDPRLLAAMRRLTEGQKRLLVGYYWRDLSDGALARQANLDPAALRQKRYRAIRKLREEMSTAA